MNAVVARRRPGRRAARLVRYGQKLDCLKPNPQQRKCTPIGTTPDTDAMSCLGLVSGPRNLRDMGHAQRGRLRG